jgi:hypothetical protein
VLIGRETSCISQMIKPHDVITEIKKTNGTLGITGRKHNAVLSAVSALRAQGNKDS